MGEGKSDVDERSWLMVAGPTEFEAEVLAGTAGKDSHADRTRSDGNSFHSTTLFGGVRRCNCDTAATQRAIASHSMSTISSFRRDGAD